MPTIEHQLPHPQPTNELLPVAVVTPTGKREGMFLLRRYWREMWLNIGLLGCHFVLSRDDENLEIPYETF